MKFGQRGESQKLAVTMTPSIIGELEQEAARLDRPVSWILRAAWQVARPAIQRFPSPRVAALGVLLVLAMACGSAPATVAPLTGVAAPGHVYTFSDALTARAAGATVTWTADGGSISSAGVWTAPSCDELRAAAGVGATYSGLLTGTTTITATWTQYGVTRSATLAVDVSEQVVSVTVAPATVELEVGESVQLHATVVCTCHTETT